MATFEEKILMLKKRHEKSHPDARTAISEWENRFAELKVKADWIKHPTTQELARMASEQVDRIISVLSNDENLKDDQRKALFREKAAHLVYLALLSEDPEAEMEVIESSVDKEL